MVGIMRIMFGHLSQNKVICANKSKVNTAVLFYIKKSQIFKLVRKGAELWVHNNLNIRKEGVT